MINWISALIIILLPFLLSSRCPNNKLKYPHPKSEPPGWVFGVIWPILYVLIALSFVRVLNIYEKDKSPWAISAIILAVLSFILNIAWIVTYQCNGQFRSGLYVFLALLFSVGLQLFITYKVDNIAGIMLVPLFIWGLFAIGLNMNVVENSDYIPYNESV